MREAERRLRRLEADAHVAVTFQPPPARDPEELKREFMEFYALIESGATELPPHMAGGPDPAAWRDFIADSIAAGLLNEPSEYADTIGND